MSGEELIGTRVGQYRIMRELGRGGMGVVFEAVHEEIGQRAAVKVLLARDTQRRAMAMRRFRNEARAASMVAHPGLVRIFDYGETAAGVPYILMELLDGELLRAWLNQAAVEERRIDRLEALRCARQIASALAATHVRGIVHRDLKPDNVMLVRDDAAPGGRRVKLLDFGIAKLDSDDESRTTEGVVLGTAVYMAPEQCTGSDVIDDRADVYALGVLLFEMLTGGPPFRGEPAHVMRQHLFRTPPPLLQRAPDIGPELERLITQMLAKEVYLRPSMAQVVERLQRCEEEPASPATAAPATPAVTPGMATEDVRTPGPSMTSTEEAPAEAAATTLPRTAASEVMAAPIALLSQVAPVSQVVAAGGEAAPVALVAPAVAVGRPVAPPPARVRNSHHALVLAIALPGLLIVGAMVWRSVSLMAPASVLQPPTLAGMVRLGGGRFVMGSSREEIDEECARRGGCPGEMRQRLERELPAHAVTVSPFQLDAREVKNAQFANFLNGFSASLDVRADGETGTPRYVEERASRMLLADLHPGAADGAGLEWHPVERRFTARPGFANKPVMNVTWDAAARFCQALGKRLPTEAEWEFAARGTGRRRHPWGESQPGCDGVVFGRGPDRGCQGMAALADVGSAPGDVTPEGIHDLGGSVSEWVEDQFADPFYGGCGECVDPVARSPVTEGDKDLRVFRGGSFLYRAVELRAATRSRFKRHDVMEGLGVRCAAR